MKKITCYKLMDGSIHQSKESAQRHIINELSKGDSLKLFEALAKQNVLTVRDVFIDCASMVNKTMQWVNEFKEMEGLKE